jgi:phosphoglucosamine mutase
MAKPLFGTDGIRGTAGTFPLDARTIQRVGAALVRVLPPGARRLLIGRDTRESGEWIERELAHGARANGAEVHSVGVAPTPAVAYLTRALQFDAGVVISASHNPFQDNGIKVFSGSGTKYSEHLEERIEELVADDSWQISQGDASEVSGVEHLRMYLDHAREALPNPGRLGPLRIAVDCANGAMTVVAPALFKELGFDVTILAAAPDGRNINKDCGSTHPRLLADTVRSDGYRIGVAFDGDGDRAIFVDAGGRVLNGDHVLLMCATQMKREGRLRGNAIVATVMSNLGLELALKKLDIGLVRCAVGDKYVMEAMQKQTLSLGGEQSGHIIFSDYLFTGDGLITALSVLQTMAVTGRELGDLADDLTTCPQVLLNLRVREKADLTAIPEITAVIEKVERRLGRNGRLLVRYSGTEPLLRVMLEGQDKDDIERMAQEIIESVRRAGLAL